MESFPQQMLENVERRNKSFGFSKSVDNMNMIGIQMNGNFLLDRKKTASNGRVFESEAIDKIDNILTEHMTQNRMLTKPKTNGLLDRSNEKLVSASIINDNGNSIRHRPETIYANCNIIDKLANDYSLENMYNNNGLNGVRIGRKPALPPKPSSQVEMAKKMASERTAIFEKEPIIKSRTTKRDPAEMSLKERLALFEGNKGNALVPKAALGMSISTKHIKHGHKNTDTIKVPLLSNSNSATVTKRQAFYEKYDVQFNGSMSTLLSSTSTLSGSQIISDVRPELNVTQNRYQQDYCNSVRQATAHPTVPPPLPPTTISPKSNPLSHIEANCTVQANNKRQSGDNIIENPINIQHDDVKRAKINQIATTANFYTDLTRVTTTAPTSKFNTDEHQQINELNREQNRSLLSEEPHKEADSFVDSDMNVLSNNCDGNLEHEFLPKKIEYFDSSTANTDDNDSTIDEYLDEALDSEDDDDDDNDHLTNEDENIDQFDCDAVTSKFKVSRDSAVSSDSFSFAKTTKMGNDLQNSGQGDEFLERNNKNPSLAHTVSFYRRQQAQNQNASPIRKMQYSTLNRNLQATGEDDDTIFDRTQENRKVEEKIKSLLDDVSIQQHHMAQTSHALNTCASTFEFSGSTESVVAEWKLLVTTHCRQSALNEISRLRFERCLRNPDASQDCGRLTINEIGLPLRPDYITKLASDAICGHHLVCLLKLHENEQVVATKTIPTLPGLLAVKFPDTLQLKNVYADFQATLEIYGMAAQREILPHDIKYHIRTKKVKTPKSKKRNGLNRLIMPPVQSPAGPNAVRTPNFIYFGSIVISLREIRRLNWTLSNMPEQSPLIGTVNMKLNCELAVKVDHKGFLTMFEDISGFGAWHRRWCHLHGNVLSYWKYPDDERKPAIGNIDLRMCKQSKILPAPRDVCARLNTILVELRRTSHERDQDSLIILRQGNETVVRHLLSSDTKEERDEWCLHLNKALTLSRAWGSSAV